MQSASVARFGAFELNLNARELCKHGGIHKLYINVEILAFLAIPGKGHLLSIGGAI
jgi:hypothetical protein